jgi:hypothetical protein
MNLKKNLKTSCIKETFLYKKNLRSTPGMFGVTSCIKEKHSYKKNLRSTPGIFGVTSCIK